MNVVRTPRFSIFLTLFALLAVAVALPLSADAKPKKKKPVAKIAKVPLVGVADNNAPMFTDPKFAATGSKISRRITPYDFYQDPIQLAHMDAWMKGAQDAGVDPLISFEHSYTYPTKLPTVAEYAEALQFALARYPNLKTISPWNEANHKSQPTVNNPKRAAQYFNITKTICPTCKIVAADVLDQTNMMPWLKKFLKSAKKPTIWGLHSYTDTNGNKTWNKSTTKAFTAAVKGEIWLTEVGGIVAFNYKYAYNEQRAAQATTRALNLGLKSPRIKRIYLYCWFGSMNPGEGSYPFKWDSGMVSPDGTARAGYYALTNWLTKYRK
ncbi:MAG: glycosyl hydrolase [Solirubrobacterales bacterium]